MPTATIILLLVAFTAKAVQDTLAHHYTDSILDRESFKWDSFWWPTESHLNKYKDRDKAKGPSFPGSTTWLVWLTDGWHLMQAVFLFCFTLALLLFGLHIYVSPLLHILIGFALVAIAKAWFEVCYRWLLIKSFWTKILPKRK